MLHVRLHYYRLGTLNVPLVVRHFVFGIMEPNPRLMDTKSINL